MRQNLFIFIFNKKQATIISNRSLINITISEAVLIHNHKSHRKIY